MIPVSLIQEIRKAEGWAITHRRHLHRSPELSLNEEQTAAYCKTVLSQLGYTIRPAFQHGFIADWNVPGAGRRIALRAEMDALPVQEENEHDFVSRNPGVAHLCGHDVHMSIALLAAKVLCAQPERLSCHLRFLFQPSEEESPGGAPGMIAEGALEEVDEIYGLHTTPAVDVGRILIREGVLMGTSSPFRLTIRGRGSHVATPEEGLSPIRAGIEMIRAWHDIPAKMTGEFRPLLNVTVFQSGVVNNVIPETAVLMGGVRAFSAADLETVQSRMRESLACFTALGYALQLEFTEGYPCVVNSAYGAARVREAAGSMGIEVEEAPLPMRFVEDFSYYLQEKPGAFYFLGGRNEAKNIVYPLHSPRYDVDEEALGVGAAVMAAIVLHSSAGESR